MIVKTVYKVGQSVFTDKPATAEYVELSRIIAEDGMLLTCNGENASCVDVPNEDVSRWSEIAERLVNFEAELELGGDAVGT